MVAHDVLTYLSAKSLDFPNIDVKINPYSYSNIDNQEYNPDYQLEYREGKLPTATAENPMYDENEYYTDFVGYHQPENGKISGLETLSLYSAEPDWGMDQGLNLARVQRLMGGSQGYRHMRYVLFLFIRSGIVDKMVTYFTRLSKIAFDRRDIYWGLRFSARAIHYIEDFLTPVHSKPFPELFLFKNLFSPSKLYFKGFNYHMNYEKLTGFHLWHANPNLTKTIKNSPIKDIKSLKSLYINADHAKIRRIERALFKEMEKLWSNKMGNKAYKISKNEIENSPLNGKLLKLTVEWLTHSASIVKGYIKEFVIPQL